MARKRYKPEEIVKLLRQAEVLHGQGMWSASRGSGGGAAACMPDVLFACRQGRSAP